MKQFNRIRISQPLDMNSGVFPKWFQWIQKIFVITVKGLEPATSCIRDQDATTAPATHVCGDRIFKLTPIHASAIYQIPWIHWKVFAI